MSQNTHILVFSIVCLGLVAMGPVAAQQNPDPQELVRLAQEGQLQQMGLQPLMVKKGTWSYPVREGWHIRQLDTTDFGEAGGIDTEFLARSSVFLTRTVRGPDLCDRSPNGVADLRVLAMQPGPVPGAFDDPYDSRLLVDQEGSRAVLFLYGTVREWKPGPEYCGGEKQMVEVGRGGGLLRLDLTTHHMGHLTFTGAPSGGGDLPEGLAGGLFSWPGGVIDLYLQSLVPGAPVAQATAAVSSGSVAEALALARSMTGRDDLPEVEEIEAQMPEGMTLDSLSNTLSGQATASSSLAPGKQEWTLTYVLEIDDTGVEVDRGGLDRRGQEPPR